MSKRQILLICGSGASSGFLASKIRKAAVKRGLDYDVFARSEADLENNIDLIDCVMVGPHLKYQVAGIEERVKGTPIKVALLDKSYYSLLDGEAALDHICSVLNIQTQH